LLTSAAYLSALGALAIMRYTNLRFTYLLTYLLFIQFSSEDVHFNSECASGATALWRSTNALLLTRPVDET